MDQIEAEREAEEAERRQATEAAKATEEKATATTTTSARRTVTTEAATEKATEAKTTATTAAVTTEATTAAASTSTSTNSQLRADMVAYAKQFLGNPYVYGGTSLTNGTDCSGFTMRIYEHFGYKIPRAGGQRTFGKLITVAEAQPGDLIFYEGHVTMYIGNGQVIHASSAKVGIIISSLSYSGTPLFARNIIDAY